MTQETNPITIVQPKTVKPPSLLLNMLVLLALFGLILGAQKISGTWLAKSPPPEDQEKQIVLEDHENDQPMAESQEVEMAAESKQETTDQKQKTESGDTETRKTEIRKTENGKRKMTKAAKKLERRTPLTQNDPYTDGGPMDLDRPENQAKQATATAVLNSPQSGNEGNERDQFIPFESQ